MLAAKLGLFLADGDDARRCSGASPDSFRTVTRCFHFASPAAACFFTAAMRTGLGLPLLHGLLAARVDRQLEHGQPGQESRSRRRRPSGRARRCTRPRLKSKRREVCDPEGPQNQRIDQLGRVCFRRRSYATQKSSMGALTRANTTRRKRGRWGRRVRFEKRCTPATHSPPRRVVASSTRRRLSLPEEQ